MSVQFLTQLLPHFFGWYICICTVGIIPLQQDKSEEIKWQPHLYASSILGALTVTEETKSAGVRDKFNANRGMPALFAHFPETKHRDA